MTDPAAASPTCPESSSADAVRGALIERLFREHNESLIRFLKARLSSSQDAKEVAQEAYVRLLQLDKPGAIGFLRAFLFKTAANIATDRIRHRQVVQSNEQQSFSAFDAFASADTGVAAAQDLDILTKALDELPSRCREVFLLRRLGGMGTDAIARRVGVTPRMIRMYLAQALLHCQQRLDEANAPRREAR